MIQAAKPNAGDLEEALAFVFQESLVGDAIQDAIRNAGEDADDDLHVERSTAFREAGVMTNDRGLVVKMSDGTEFHLTIVQSN